MNIQVSPESGDRKFFIRLDLSPGASADVENPDCRASLRADTGLEFRVFPDVDLADADKLVFSDPPALEIVAKDGNTSRIVGYIKGIVPGKGDRPVCSLESFHPLMPMKDVCELLAPDTPTDDNGALIAGLGFAGLTWAARLAPARDGPVGSDTLLEHLELRRPFSLEDLERALSYLLKKGYVPWQAEFPGRDIDFSTGDAKENEKVLLEAVKNFAKSGAPRPNPADAEPDASIMLAPASLLPALNDGDAPARDVQLFSINLRPASGILLVDVAAYKGEAESPVRTPGSDIN
ncbi:MAG: peptidoglycan glycosyltransferase [Desulfovibrio sp.]|nr:peptidoglycan glycosyltransferase [Desulfovibrio sp.]